ncbi:MAG: recombinase family protein [Intestinibacillus sp.]
MRLAGYCRISVDEELDQENTSIENQKALIEEFVSGHFPDAPLDFFTDRDRSGYTFEQREGYQKLRRALMRGEYDVLILKDFSRFSRRNSLGLYELELLRDAGVRIVSIGDHVDYPTNDDWLNIQFRFLMNEMPVTDTSKKVRAVVRNRQSRGEWICNAPYGYFLDPVHKGALQIDEEGAAVVRLIYRLYNEGWGYKRIAGYLTEKGFPTGLQLMAKQLRTQGKDTNRVEARVRDVWNANSVAKILGNDFYIGTLRQGVWERRGINKTDRRTEPSRQFVFEDHHAPILDKAVFAQAVQNKSRRTRTHYRGERKYPHTYSGLLYCEDCGSPMFAVSNPARPDGYVCGAYHRRGRKGCTSHHIRERAIDDSVRAYIGSVRDGLTSALAQLDESRSEAFAGQARARAQGLRERLEQLKRELRESTRQRIRQITAHPEREEAINETFDTLEEEYRDELGRLERQLALLEDEAGKRADMKRSLSRVIAIFEQLMTKERFTRQDIETIIARIDVAADGSLTIELKSDIGRLLDLL